LTQFDSLKNLLLEDAPSALQSFAMGDGIPQVVQVWGRSWPHPSKKIGTRIINTERKKAWLHEGCIWKQHGVWGLNDTGNPVVLKPNYFRIHPITGKQVDFNKDFYLPFVKKYAAAIHEVHSDAFLFISSVPSNPPPTWSVLEREASHVTAVNAPHWYDLKSVFSKTFNSLITHDVQGLSAVSYPIISGNKKHNQCYFFWNQRCKKELHWSNSKCHSIRKKVFRRCTDCHWRMWNSNGYQ
jgi:hypothetical protein